METRRHGREMDGWTTQGALRYRPLESGVIRGRRTKANVLRNRSSGLLVAAGQLQRACGRPFRNCRRGRSVLGVSSKVLRRRTGEGNFRSARATHAAKEPGTEARCHATECHRQGRAHFPSLRAHNPILPGAIHRILPAKYLKLLSCSSERSKTSPCATRVQSCWDNARTPMVKTRDCSGFRARQLTNRRMRTFIATPSARNVNNTEDPP
jgi:hypothetical protein